MYPDTPALRHFTALPAGALASLSITAATTTTTTTVVGGPEFARA